MDNNKNSRGGQRGKKRKYRDRTAVGGGGSDRHKGIVLKHPKRGGPGILMTCETGQEFKCQREGLEIIHHYYHTNAIGKTKEGGGGDTVATSITSEKVEATNANQSSYKDKPLSLEEELKQLQEQSSKGGTNASSEEFPFGIYETGCRGCVFVLCTSPSASLIPSIKSKLQTGVEGNDKDNGDNNGHANNSDNEKDDKSSKKQRIDSDAEANVPESTNEGATTTATTLVSSSPSLLLPTDSPTSQAWDPVPMVHQILKDLKSDSSAARQAPCSRFVWRMIPIQATCYTSEQELKWTSRYLLERHLASCGTEQSNNSEQQQQQQTQGTTTTTTTTPKTFGIAIKRRLCGEKTFSKDLIIDTVATQVLDLLPNCKVHLDNPELSIVVEVCKTLCGISVIANRVSEFANFNLVSARVSEK